MIVSHKFLGHDVKSPLTKIKTVAVTKIHPSDLHFGLPLSGQSNFHCLLANIKRVTRSIKVPNTMICMTKPTRKMLYVVLIA